MAVIRFTQTRPISSADSTEEKIELLNEQLETLRQDLEVLLNELAGKTIISDQ